MIKPPAIILAGGRAQRMGGGDKVLLPLGARPLLSHVVDVLWPQVDALALSANGNPERFSAFGLPVFADAVAEQPGPLAGILAGLRWAESRPVSVLMTTAGDTPFLPNDLVARLMEVRGDAEVVVASRDGRLQPVVAVWASHLGDAVEAALNAGQRGVEDFIRTRKWAAVSFDGGPDPFLNINTAEDLSKAESIIASDN